MIAGLVIKSLGMEILMSAGELFGVVLIVSIIDAAKEALLQGLAEA